MRLPLFIKKICFPFKGMFFRVEGENVLYCNHFIRQLSAVIDLIFLAVLLNVISKILISTLPLENLVGVKLENNLTPTALESFKKQMFIFILIQLFILVGIGLAIAWSWHKYGQSAGKFLLGIKIVDKNTLGNISFSQALTRLLAVPFSVIPFLMGFMWVALDKKGQAWHDKLARTVVIKK